MAIDLEQIKRARQAYPYHGESVRIYAQQTLFPPSSQRQQQQDTADEKTTCNSKIRSKL